MLTLCSTQKSQDETVRLSELFAISLVMSGWPFKFSAKDALCSEDLQCDKERRHFQVVRTVKETVNAAVLLANNLGLKTSKV